MARPLSFRATLPGTWRIFRRFWPYIRKQKFLIASSSLALLVEVGLRLLEPWPLKLIFDHVFAMAPAESQRMISALAALDRLSLLTLSAVALVVITSLRALAAYSSAVGFALVGNRVLAEVRSDLYRHLQRLSLSFHARARGGDLVVRVIGDVGMLKEVTVTAFLPLASNLLILVGMFGVMLWLQWRLVLLAMITVPLFWLSMTRLSLRIQDAARNQRKREGAMAATAAESMGAIKVVQALSLEEKFDSAFSSQNQQDLKEGVKVKRLAAGLERRVDIFIAIATALVLWYGAQLVLRQELTPGDLLVFLTYLKNAFKPVRDFAKYTSRLAKATASGERVIDLLDRSPEVQDLPTAVPAPAFWGAIRFKEVNFVYEPDNIVLHEIDFAVEPGQYIALVGPSGAGKSTITSLLLRLYDPITGCVMIDGHDIRSYTLESVRRQISVVMQDSLLFAASVRDNIAYGADGVTVGAVEAVAKLANAHDFIMALPDGYDTLIGERGVTLSNGERQRIAIARAAIRNAPIIILDEPATGLDEKNEQVVIQALERLASRRRHTTLLITHDLTHAARANKVVYLEAGRILESGTHLELLRANGRYAALYRLQVDGLGYNTPKESSHAHTV